MYWLLPAKKCWNRFPIDMFSSYISWRNSCDARWICCLHFYIKIFLRSSLSNPLISKLECQPSKLTGFKGADKFASYNLQLSVFLTCFVLSDFGIGPATRRVNLIILGNVKANCKDVSVSDDLIADGVPPWFACFAILPISKGMSSKDTVKRNIEFIVNTCLILHTLLKCQDNFKDMSVNDDLRAPDWNALQFCQFSSGCLTTGLIKDTVKRNRASNPGSIK